MATMTEIGGLVGWISSELTGLASSRCIGLTFHKNGRGRRGARLNATVGLSVRSMREAERQDDLTEGIGAPVCSVSS